MHADGGSSASQADQCDQPQTLKEAREAAERELVQEALRRHGGKITSAAMELGVPACLASKTLTGEFAALIAVFRAVIRKYLPPVAKTRPSNVGWVYKLRRLNWRGRVSADPSLATKSFIQLQIA